MVVPDVMQAPIGPATTPDLVTAVSNAGGLGCLAASWTPVLTLGHHIQAIQRATGRPYAVNLVLAFDQAERLDLLLELQVPVISFSWGIDTGAIGRAHAAGAAVYVQVGDVEEGRRAAAAGAGALIAQGVEAGGHVQSRAPLLELVGALRAAIDVPVLAAGGIADAAAATAARAAGAAGVVAGTAFLAASEADVHPAYRNRLIAAGAADTVLTGLFDGGWRDAPHRVLRNATVEAWERAGAPPPGERPGEAETVATVGTHAISRYADAQPTTRMRGDVEAMALYAGRGVGSVTRVEPAEAIVDRLRPPGSH